MDNVIENSILLNLKYEEVLDLDPRTYGLLMNGYIKKREIAINDALSVIHVGAIKISQAIWGSKEFSNPIEPFELCRYTEDPEEFNNRILEEKVRKQGEAILSKYK